MIRFLASTSLLTALCFVSACDSDKPTQTTPPEDGITQTGDSEASDGAGEAGEAGEAKEAAAGGDSTGKETAEAKPPGEDPEKKVCDAKVLDAPTPLFSESLLIRLPHGIDPDSIIEHSPMFLQAPEFESVGCVEGLPGAMVSFSALGYFEDDTKKSLPQFRDEILKQLGFPEGLKFNDEVTNGRNYETAVDVPPDAKNPQPAKLWFALKGKYGRLYYVVYQVHPRAWNAMRKTLKQSTDKMYLLNVGG